MRRLSQRWRRPLLSEARLLGLAPDRLALVREVVLSGNGSPWVYARSVIPASALHGELAQLRRLDNAPLGALLFRFRGLKRTPFEFVATTAAQLPLPEHATEAPVWGRRSRFSLGRRHILVSEFFLPAFQPQRPPPRR